MATPDLTKPTEVIKIISVDETSNGEIVTVFFRTKDVAQVNMFRRAVLAEIETYAIDLVVFHDNNTARIPEILALRLGQLVIDQSDGQSLDDVKVEIDVECNTSEKRVVSTDDIPELKFRYRTPIITLKPGQRLVCDCIVRKGTGKNHVKWRPVSVCSFTEVDDGYNVTFETIGMLTPEQIIRKGVEKISVATEWQPQTLFAKPLLPIQTDDEWKKFLEISTL